MKKLLTAVLLCLASSLPTMAQKAVSNLTSGNEYDGLSTAINNANTGDVLQINKDINVSFVINPNDKDITIQGKTSETAIILKKGNETDASLKMFINLNKNASGSLTLKNIVVNAEASATTNKFIEQVNGSLTLENVTIKNLVYNNSNIGIIRINTAPKVTILDNVVFENCKMTDGSSYEVVNATNDYSINLKGKADYTIRLNNASASIANSGIAPQSKVKISYGSHTATVPVVKGSTNLNLFELTDNTQMLAPQGEDLYAIAYAKILLVNNTESGKESKGFENLYGSSGAGSAAGTDAEIIVNEDINYSGSTNLYGKTVLIRGAKPSVAINIAGNYQLANANAANTHITLQDLVINGNFDGFNNYLAQASSENSSVTIENVTIQNFSNAGTAMLRANKGVWNLKNVTFSNCEMTSGKPLVLTNNSGCSISGVMKGLSLLINNAATTEVDAAGLSSESEKIKVTLGGTAGENYWHDNQIITNCVDTSLFELTNSGWSLMADNGGIKILENKIVTGVEEVEAEADGAAEYFDLRGQRVAADALASGFYICRKGGKATKIVVR